MLLEDISAENICSRDPSGVNSERYSTICTAADNGIELHQGYVDAMSQARTF